MSVNLTDTATASTCPRLAELSPPIDTKGGRVHIFGSTEYEARATARTALIRFLAEKLVSEWLAEQHQEQPAEESEQV